MIAVAGVFAAVAKVVGHLSAVASAVEAYQAARAKVIAQHPTAANDLPDLEAVIAEARVRLDAWDRDIDAREARLRAKVEAEVEPAPEADTRLDP